MRNHITRRDFIKSMSLGAAAISMYSSSSCSNKKKQQSINKDFLINRSDLTKVDPIVKTEKGNF